MKKGKSVTIKDIARKFKCSPSTVSRALNNNLSINEHTRKNIQEYAEKMGYQRNAISLSLVNQKTWTIGIIVPNIIGYFFAAVIDGIQSTLEPLGYTLTIFQTKEFVELEVNYIKKLLSIRVDGIFVCVAQETKEFSHFETVIKQGVPLIFFDRSCSFKTHHVTVDQFSGAVMAVEHLVKMGCKRIAHLKGPQGLTIAQQRFEAYLQVLKKHNLPILDELIIPTGFTIWKGVYPVKQLLDLPIPPDAIFAANDQIALAAMHVIKERGLEVPKDIAVVGFDNEPHTAYCYPTITTVAQPTIDMGREAAQIFINQVNAEEEFPIQNINLPAELIIRESSLK